jgi:cytochrome c1
MGVRIVLIATLLLTACDNPGVEPNIAGVGAVARGKVAAEKLGCGACHQIQGIWPRGMTGPSLENFARRGLIAGKLPNRPDALAAFLLDPSGTGMPKVPMTRQNAADIAAFLQQTDAP